MNLCVVGGHSGDEAVTCGALIHKYTKHGHKAVLLSLTNGDGGHPVLSRAEYGPQKDREARQAAEILGAEAVLFPISSRNLPVSEEIASQMAQVFQDHKIDCIITHWRDCIHADHTAAHYNTLYARRMYKGDVPVFFADNWEDRCNFNADILIALEQDDIDAWSKACNQFEFFREKFYSFQYEKFYRNVFTNWGYIMRSPQAANACALMQMTRSGTMYESCIPGFPL